MNAPATSMHPRAAGGSAAAEASAASATSIWPAFIVLVLAMLPAVLDQTILATALPTIAGDLGTLADVSWLVSAYVIASAATIPVWGRVGDRLGRRTVLERSLVLFLAASAACGLAGDLTTLI